MFGPQIRDKDGVAATVRYPLQTSLQRFNLLVLLGNVHRTSPLSAIRRQICKPIPQRALWEVLFLSIFVKLSGIDEAQRQIRILWGIPWYIVPYWLHWTHVSRRPETAISLATTQRSPKRYSSKCGPRYISLFQDQRNPIHLMPPSRPVRRQLKDIPRTLADLRSPESLTWPQGLIAEIPLLMNHLYHCLLATWFKSELQMKMTVWTLFWRFGEISPLCRQPLDWSPQQHKWNRAQDQILLGRQRPAARRCWFAVECCYHWHIW